MDIDEKLLTNVPEAATECTFNSAVKPNVCYSTGVSDAYTEDGSDLHHPDGHGGHGADNQGCSVPSVSSGSNHPVIEHTHARTHPLSMRQERRLVAYLDDALYDLLSNFKKRYFTTLRNYSSTYPFSPLRTLPSYLRTIHPILALIL